jgi:hypothetical protein
MSNETPKKVDLCCVPARHGILVASGAASNPPFQLKRRKQNTGENAAKMDDEYVLMTFAVQVLCWKVKPLKRRRLLESRSVERARVVIETWITTNENVENDGTQFHGCVMSRRGLGELVVAAATLRGLLSVVSSAALDRHGSLVVSATAQSVVSSAALLGSGRGVVSASSDGHCECDGGGDEDDKEINVDVCFGLWALGFGPGLCERDGVADSGG